MWNNHSVTSGDNCNNLQVASLKIVRDFSKEEINEFKNEIINALLAQQDKEGKINNITSAHYDQVHNMPDEEHCKLIDPKDLVDLIEKWNPNQSNAQRIDALDKILHSCSNIIVNNPDLALFIQHNVNCHQNIRDLITPACNMALDKKISIIECNNLLYAMNSGELNLNRNFTLQQQKYFIRVLYSILYQDDSSYNDKIITETLSIIPVLENDVFAQFFVDAYYRISCNYLFVGQASRYKIEEMANLFYSQNPNSPLTYLKRIVLDPMGIYEKYSFQEIIDDLSKIAFLCKNVIESRWVISALFRILPLYKTEDVDIDYDKAKYAVISRLSKELISKFIFLKYLELKNFLYLFYMTGDISRLSKYESYFGESCESLRLDQQLSLQIEYASCIHMYLINNTIDLISGSKFAAYAESGCANLIEKALFANILVIDDEYLNVSPKYTNKGLLLKWLYVYIEKIYTLYLERRLEQNPFMLVNFRATSKVPVLSTKIYSVVSKYIQSIPVEYIDNNSSFACKALSLIEFSKVSKSISIDKQTHCAISALKASSYEILINAKSISYVLYYLKYYSDGYSLCPQLEELVVEFKKSIPYHSKSPKLCWATVECITILDNVKELEFIVSMFKSFESANIKISKLSLKNGEEFSLSIPAECIEVIKQKSNNGSVLAMIAIDYLMVTEFWNLLATTIFNISYPNRIMSLKISSMFYSLAMCFAREQRHIDQKYSYNYIRVQSLYYEESKFIPPNAFFRDCSYYINMPNNQFFTYKEVCCVPFFKLIKLYYNNLPNYIHQLYSDQILPKWYWVKKSFEKMSIGIFAEDIKIK